MVGRWRMALQELDYTIGYVQGKNNTIADAMSRLCLNNMEKKTGLVSSLHVKQPTTLQQYEIIEKCHNATVGHGGVQRTLRNLQKQKHSWPGMKEAIKTFIKNSSTDPAWTARSAHEIHRQGRTVPAHCLPNPA